ncbi:MAG: FAD-dependent oxidoreductase [Bacteroidota bacterium]
MKKVVIIGAGPAGLSCAYTLAKAGVEVELFEASPYLGGMSRSFELFGQKVDCGPHRLFSKQPQVNAFFHEIMGDDYTLIDRLTRIYYRRTFFYYPLRIGNVLRNLPLLEITKILWDYFRQRLTPIRNPRNFEQWVTNRFGRQLFNTFFKTYSEKLWGIPCTRIDASWAAQRIKSLSLLAAVKNAFFGDPQKKHKTLVDQFAFPNGGTGRLYEKCAAQVEALGQRIHLEQPVKKVVLDEAGEKAVGVELVDGQVIEADAVVSTMPLTLLLKGLPAVPEAVQEAASKLYFRNTILVYLDVEAENLFDDNWIYVHASEVLHGRITNFRNWGEALHQGKKGSVLCLEFWCFDADDLWTEDDDRLIERAKAEIRQVGLVSSETPIREGRVLRIPRCYPVYETGYQQHLDLMVAHLRPIQGLTPIGRYGAFKYNNQDHSILMGLLAAENILNPDQPPLDLWGINTDTEYQEEGKIKDVLIQ